LDSKATILHLIATQARCRDLIGFLLDRGADVSIRDEEFHGTPIDWVRHFRLDDVVDPVQSCARR
jgi:hypothetical protein